MRTFYLSSTAAQSILLAALFLTLILSLFLLIVSFTGYRDKRNRYMNMPIFLFLFILLSELTDAFSRMNEGLESSPFVAALVHRGCRRFSAYMGNRAAAQAQEARAQPRFGQTGYGFAAKRNMLFHTFRER